MRIAIIGAAELGKLIAWHATNDGGHEIVGYYDDFKTDAEFNGLPVLGKSDQIDTDFSSGKFDALMVGIGYNHMKVRKAVFERFKGRIPFANIIHSSCYVDSSVKLGEGIFLLPGTVIDMEAEVGDNVLMNTQVTVAHHTRIEAHCFLAPGVHLAGLIHVGECSFIGIGCTVIDCINIAPWSVIGAGAVVINDTEPYSVSVGTPSRIIKYKEQ